MLKCVLIGAGYIAQNHVDALISNPDTELVGVVCRNPEHARWIEERVPSCRYFSTFEEAWKATKPDFADITTPTDTHEQYVVLAAKLGCHVFCEKPATFTAESFDRMCKACNDAGVKFMIAQVVRFLAYPKKVKEWISEEKLGSIHMYYQKRLCQHPTWSTWHRDPAISGGALYDLHVHDLDFIYSLFGLPSEVFASGWKSPGGCWNHVVSNLKWKNGMTAVCEGCIEMTGNFPFSVEIRADGDMGTLHHVQTAGANINDGQEQLSLTWYPADSAEAEKIAVEPNDGFVEELGAFIDSINGNKGVPIAQEEIRDVLSIIEALKQSLETGKVVSVRK